MKQNCRKILLTNCIEQQPQKRENPILSLRRLLLLSPSEDLPQPQFSAVSLIREIKSFSMIRGLSSFLLFVSQQRQVHRLETVE